jgi:hypothetical protein
MFRKTVEGVHFLWKGRRKTGGGVRTDASIALISVQASRRDAALSLATQSRQ